MSRVFLALLGAVAVRAYAAVLRLYPSAFRERCGGPMLHTFEQRCAELRSEGRLIPFIRECIAEVLDAVRGVRRSYRAERSLPPIAYESRARDSFLAVLLQDSAYALRRLKSQPALVFFTVLTLGFAMAANAAIFSIADAVMIRQSPFAEPERLFNLMNASRRGGYFPGLSRDKLRHWRSERDIFDAVEAYRRTSVVVTGGVEPEELPAAMVSPGLLATLGVPPRAGRMFVPTEGRAGEDAVVLVSERYWRTRLGGDDAAIGRQVSINGRLHTIVGVMPSRFAFPTRDQQVWLPMDPEARSSDAGLITEILVRLAPGLTREAAAERISIVVKRLEAERPLPSGWGIVLRPGSISGPDEVTQRAVLVLFGAVALVLLVACANVANLLLSRAVDRHRELAIRLVLGASRWRLFRELLVEGLMLGLAAGGLGLLVANWAIDTLLRLAPANLMNTTNANIAVDGRVLAFTLILSLLTGVICNLAPALRTFRANGAEALSGRTRTSTDAPVQRRLRAGLVVLEVALAVVLLVGAALMVRTFVRLNAVDIGFNPDKLLAVVIGLDTERYGTEVARVALLRQLADDVKALPGVTGVAIASGLPPAPGTLGLAMPESETGPCGEETSIVANMVSPSYFSLMGIRIAGGRALREDDETMSVVASRSLAGRCGGERLVGKRLRLGPTAPWLRVVGIAADVKSFGITRDEGSIAIYLPLQTDLGSVLPITATMHERRVTARRLIVQHERPATIVESVKRALWARDPDQPILRVAPAAELMADSIRRERFMLTLMTLFSAVALALASAGIFGVLAYSVAQRTNEIGIRMALGASSSNVLRLVVGQGLGLAALGVATGIAGAYALSRVLAGLLFEVDARDPVAFVSMPLLVFMVALLASWIPTMRALRVDPASALRVE